MNKPILIQGAMDTELCLLKSLLPTVKEETLGGFLFTHCQVHDYPVILSKTEIGMVHASSATTLALEHYRPAVVLNQGLAGAHRPELICGDLILGQSCCSIHSVQSPLQEETQPQTWKHWDFFLPPKDQNLAPSLSGDASLCALFAEAEYRAGKKLLGTLGSGDVWNRETQRIQHLASLRNSFCEDMESFAVYQICERQQVPVLGLRVISNNELSKLPYDEGVGEALQQFVYDSLPALVDWAKSQECAE